jgi:hypothetical protein
LGKAGKAKKMHLTPPTATVRIWAQLHEGLLQAALPHHDTQRGNQRQSHLSCLTQTSSLEMLRKRLAVCSE